LSELATRNVFIDLGRHFVALSKDREYDEDYETQIAFGSASAVTWHDVLEKRRVVVLAKAGAGKTEEIRNKTRELRRQGKRAFFLRLEHISKDFEIAFDIGDFAEFQEWLAGEDEAWFFLDSVDEARLGDPKDFELAIRKFSRRLDGRGQRARIFLTSRVGEWRMGSDLRLIDEMLPYQHPSTTILDKNPSDEAQGIDDLFTGSETVETRSGNQGFGPEVLALSPLSTNQIRRFAVATGVEEADEFISEILRNDAKMFASCPLDLIDLVEFWNDHKRIGSRLELLRASTTKKLSERDPDRAAAWPLAKEKARKGAEILAGVDAHKSGRLARHNKKIAVGEHWHRLRQRNKPHECFVLAQGPLCRSQRNRDVIGKTAKAGRNGFDSGNYAFALTQQAGNALAQYSITSTD